MAIKLVTFVDVSGSKLVRFGRIRGRAPAAPDRHVITAPAQLRRLEDQPLAALKFVGGRVLAKTKTERASDRAAVRARHDQKWIDRQRRQARDDVLLGFINELRELQSLAPLTDGDLDVAYNARVAAARP